MSKKMLINALHAEEARVAIVEDGRLVDLDVEIAGSEQIRGNIYKGIVVRVEPGLQAAFVDIGLKKLGFLQMGEIHPENYKWRDDIPEEQRHRRPRIQEILRRGQELTVQVEKGERDNKGSALTTYVSLPGRYMVLMPGSDSAGISRKVEGEGERKKLKEIISEMNIPEGYGYIIRTEAMGRTRDELQRDLDSLISLYEGVKEQSRLMKSAGMIYQESALIIRTIRDYFSADIDEVLVDSKDVFKDVREALKEIDPQFEKLVKLHQEKRPIFSRYQLEEQIDLIYEKKVPLKSGGSIFIEPTEALVSIDVNSGKSTGEKGVEDTAFKTNMEAAEEAARQLRLRDLGGLIVIDFIDMRDRKHNAEVEKTLKSALKADKARVNVARISEFGLLEMSRQRIRQTLHQASTLECPHCDGRGKVKSVEAMAVSFLRKVHAAAAKGTVAEVMGSLPLEVAYYLLNRKRHELSRIENDYDIQVTVKGKPSYLLNQMELELVKREKLVAEELPQEKGAPSRPAEAAPQEAAAEGRKKKKRGKKGQGEAAAPAAPAEAAAPQEEVAAPGEAAAAPEAGAPQFPSAHEEGGAEGALAAMPPAHEAFAVALIDEPEGAERVLTAGEHEEPKKKRRRKRRRGKGGGAEAGHGAEVAIDVPAELPEGVAAEAAAPQEGGEQPAEVGEFHAEAGEHAGEEVKKKRRRRRKRGKGHEGAASETVAAVAMAGAPAGDEAEGIMPPEGPSQWEAIPSEPPLSQAEVVALGEEAGTFGGAAEGAAAGEKPKKPRRPRAKKGAAEAPAAAAEAGEAPGEVAAAPEQAPAPVVEGEGAPAAGAPAAAEAVTAEVIEAPKGRKRGRGGRGKAGEAAAAAGELPETLEVPEIVPVAEPLEVRDVAEATAPTAAAESAEARKPARGRRGAKTPKAPVTEAPGGEGEAAPAGAMPPETAPAGAMAPETAPAGPAPAETAPGEGAPPKKRPGRPKSKEAGTPGAGEPEGAAEKPKKRAPRKKKEE